MNCRVLLLNPIICVMFEDVQIIEKDLGNGGKLAILRGGFHSPNPKAYMDNVVSDYVRDHIYNEFIEENLDTPWVRVIITGINALDYYNYADKRGLDSSCE